MMLFGALAASSPVLDAPVILPLAALAIVQVLEPKIPALALPRGRVAWIILKLALCYLLIGFTGSIQSNFWLLLMLPVVSAATALGLAGTLLFTAMAARRLPLLPALPGLEHLHAGLAGGRRAHPAGAGPVPGRQPGQPPRGGAARAERKASARGGTTGGSQPAGAGGGGGGKAIGPAGGAGPAHRRTGARTAQPAGHHQGVGGDAGQYAQHGK